MKVAVLGTGVVGQAHAGKLSNLGHDVVVGTHDPKEALARKDGFGPWIRDHARVMVKTFADAAASADIIFEALGGQAALGILKPLEKELSGKILIDISNPLDFSQGRPPTLFVSNNDSLGEQIQAALPDTKVVKAFNTMSAAVQTTPGEVADGDHHLFICGNDQKAKDRVIKLAREDYGWQKILDLGDIKSARGQEMMLPIWLQIMGSLNSSKFNFKIAQ